MGLLDFFKSATRRPKKKKEAKVPKDIGQKEIKKEKKIRRPAAKRKREEEKGAPEPVKLKESKTAWRVLVEPHVTEKSSGLTALSQYTFRVFDDATRMEIKRAINEIYDVHAERVRKIRVARKQRSRATRRKKQMGWRSGYTKAVVTLKKGEKIEVLPH